MNQNIQTITDFLSDRMEGEPCPAAKSAEMQKLSAAVAELHKHDSQQELRELALRVLGLVIDRARASLRSEALLEKFIRGETDY